MNITSFQADDSPFGARFQLVSVHDMDNAGIDCAIEAFFLHDPYYPRPERDMNRDGELWREF